MNKTQDTDGEVNMPYPLWSHFQAISLKLLFSCRTWYRATAAWATWAATYRQSTASACTSGPGEAQPTTT